MIRLFKNNDGIWETNLIPNSCGIKDITVLNGDVYVVGDDNKERATIWKMEHYYIKKLRWITKVGLHHTPLAIDGNDIYVSGNYLWNEMIGLWKKWNFKL